MIKLKRRVVTSTIEPIWLAEAQALIVEARINVAGKLDVYERCPTTQGFLQQVFTLEVPDHWDNCRDGLLEYARDHIPSDITFGL